MFDIGFWEIILIAVVALLVVGPERFPGMIKKAGYWVGQFRRIISAVKVEVQQEIDKADQLQNLLDEQKDIVERNTNIDVTQPAVKPKSLRDHKAVVSPELQEKPETNTSNTAEVKMDKVESDVQKK